MVFGYARVSTNSQARDGNSLDFQVQALKQAGAVEIFSDVFSGSKNARPQLNKLLNIIQFGDILIITKLDRIARSVIHGIQLIENLNSKGVTIDVLNMGIIDDSPTGKLIRNIMLAFSEFERDMIIFNALKRAKLSPAKTLIFMMAALRNFLNFKLNMLLSCCRLILTNKLPL